MTRGRPTSPETQEKTRRALLDAAHECLQVKSYKEISLREIAALAKQNSAMIAYYFGNKESLFIELLHEGIGADSHKLIEELAQQPQPDMELALRKLVTQFITLHRRSPWLSRFIVDNVILKQGNLRKLFVSKVLASNGKRILDLLSSLQENGKIGSQWNPEYCRISLISLLAFPFVANPVLKDSFGFDIHEVDMDEWVNHTVNLLLMGFQAR
jgi:TetR/AcrR family transcriptional regulator